MTNIVNHWKGITEGFDAVKVNQIRDDGTDNTKSFITTGEGFESKTVEFSVFRENTTGNFYPQQSAPWAFASDVSYFLAAVPVKALNAATNTVLGICKTGTALNEIRKNWADKEFSKKDALKPAFSHFCHTAKDAAALAGGYALYTYLPAASCYFAVAALGGATLASVYDPVKMRSHIQRFESRWNVTPLNDGQARQLTMAGKVKHFCDGTFSLPRALNLHCMGNRSEKIEGELKFDLVDDKKTK